jgi:hypothetical protein
MKKLKGFTRIDALIALACIVLILAQAGIINAGGRERSKLEVCLSNLRSLVSAWQTYSNDNSGKIPCGDVYYSWAFPGAAGSSTGPQPAWREWPHPSPHSMPPTKTTNYTATYSYGTSIPQSAWEHATAEGTMWKYVGDYNIYRCPSSAANQFVTYSMSQSMNCYPGAGAVVSLTITNINQITKPAERFVFLDCGVAKQGAFFVVYNESGTRGKWYDQPPRIHNMGTNFVFADGHAIYRKWTDPSAILAATGGCSSWGGCSIDYCDCDLRWMTKITWGGVSYTCTDPNKNCEY